MRAKAKAKHHTDTEPGWIKREIARLDRLIRESNAAKTLQAATIGKGGITVKGGGQINVLFPDGNQGIVLGPMRDGSGGQIGSAIEVHRGDGSAAVLFGVYHISPGLSADFPTGYEFFQVSADDAQIGASKQAILAGGSATIVCDDVGGVAIGSAAGTFIQHSTTGASANTFIDPSDSRIWRSTSSLRYKQDVEDAEVDPADVMQLVGRTWRDKGQVEKNADETTRYSGFIAEEVHALPSLRQFVIYDDEGRPDAIAYDRLSVAVLAVLKSFEARLAALEAKAAEA